MSGLALGLVLVAALLHASWNFLAKKSRNKMAFIWWFLLIASIGYLPMFLYFWPRLMVTPAGWACIVATGVLHALYFWFMGGGIREGRSFTCISSVTGFRTPFGTNPGRNFPAGTALTDRWSRNRLGCRRDLLHPSEFIQPGCDGRAFSCHERKRFHLGAMHRRNHCRLFPGR